MAGRQDPARGGGADAAGLRRPGLAVVTGASEGIGREIARLAAADGWPVVLVARRADALEALAGEIGGRGGHAEVLPLDLAEPGAAAALWQALDGRQVGLVVNNAGFGLHGPFASSDPARLAAMIAVNVTALTELSRLALGQMTAAGEGRILNVASLAGFAPGPNLAVYHATKAYVVSLSVALAEELRRAGHRGVSVTALCPGPVRTGFVRVAGLEGVRILRLMPAAQVGRIARIGYRAAMRRRGVVVPGVLPAVAAMLARMAPPRLAAMATGMLMSR